MIKPTNLFVISCAVIGAYFVHHAYAVSTAPAAFSQYGQIQAVQNYSSNPFWHPGSPYNQKAIPKPIYVTGADLNTGDCNRIVENLVASFCVSNNNCTGMRLADVRPTIMVQLSQLPGHNFATSCGGYIDSIFNKYAKSGTALNLPLPTGTTTGTATFQFKNPYEIKPTAEQQAVADRAAELAALQAQTGGVTGVSAAAFPKTLADLSFTDRMANAATGYEPYKDKSAYAVPNFEDENSAEFLDRLQKRNPSEYCKRFPTATVDGTDCKCILNPDDTACKTAPTPTPTPTPTPDATYFIFWDCRGTPQHHSNLITTRNAGNTGVDIRRANCKIRPGRSATHNCIGMKDTPNKGIINRLFHSKFNYWIERGGSSFYNLNPENSRGVDFNMTDSDADAFIDTIVSNINDVKKECTSNEAWRLFVDKHIVTNGQHIYKPYKTICIGGDFCTAGEIKTH